MNHYFEVLSVFSDPEYVKPKYVILSLLKHGSVEPRMENKAHYLKISSVYLDALNSGEKTFEYRLNDRFYQKGDFLVFEK